MSNEVEQQAAVGRKSSASVQSPGEKKWTDIGEAQIVETIFGKAKIRITHKHDGVRRAGLIGLLLAGLAMAILIWQMAFSPQPDEVSQSAVSTPYVNEISPVSAHLIQQEATASSSTPAIVINKPVSSRKRAAQQVVETMPVTPVVPLLKENAAPVIEDQQHAIPNSGQ